MGQLLINERSTIPLFHLTQRDGEIFDVSDYKRKKNLVLFFLSAPDVEFFVRLDQHMSALRSENAQVVVISPLDISRIQDLYKKNHLGFLILSDEKMEVFSKFIARMPDEPVAALFITDKYGDVFFRYLSARAAQLPPFDDIIRSLVFVESQCPECGGFA